MSKMDKHCFEDFKREIRSGISTGESATVTITLTLCGNGEESKKKLAQDPKPISDTGRFLERMEANRYTLIGPDEREKYRAFLKKERYEIQDVVKSFPCEAGAAAIAASCRKGKFKSIKKGAWTLESLSYACHVAKVCRKCLNPIPGSKCRECE
jgi:ribosomal protein L40E